MKTVLDSLADLPEPLHEEYEERGGKYHLKLDGPLSGVEDANAKIVEFRQNNIALKQEMEKLKADFNGIDPAAYKSMETKIAELEARGIKGGGDITALISKAVEPIQSQLAEMRAGKEASEKALQRKELETTLTKAALQGGVAEQAIPDFLRRGAEVWTIEDGKPTAKNGNVPLFSKSKAAEPLTIAEWVTDLPQEAPHLFKPNSGGGASTKDGKGGAVTYDPNDPAAIVEHAAEIAAGKMVARE